MLSTPINYFLLSPPFSCSDVSSTLPRLEPCSCEPGSLVLHGNISFDCFIDDNKRPSKLLSTVNMEKNKFYLRKKTKMEIVETVETVELKKMKKV